MCDLAQYYGIYDLEALPVKTLAGLSCGLPPESRTMMKASGMKISLQNMLLATIADRLGILCWMKSKDGRRGTNRPKSILSELMTDKKENNIMTFEGKDDFQKAWENLNRGGD